MANNNNMNKKGFAGLINLASEIQELDEPIETKPKAKSKAKLIFGILGIFFLIWLIATATKNLHTSSCLPSSSQKYSSTQSSSSPKVDAPSVTRNNELQYIKPPIGTNNILSSPEIRWCLREEIRLEAMRDIINTNAKADKFNNLVNDYNSRCGSFRYRKGTLEQAKREVEPHRYQIVANVIRRTR